MLRFIGSALVLATVSKVAYTQSDCYVCYDGSEAEIVENSCVYPAPPPTGPFPDEPLLNNPDCTVGNKYMCNYANGFFNS